MGRPSIYTTELADEICTRLANGESLRSICRDDHIPARITVVDWIIKNREGFADQYAHARDVGLDVMADQLLDISATPLKAAKKKFTRVVAGPVPEDGDDNDERNLGTEIETTTGDAVDRARLHADTLKWYLSKLAPKRYGDKIAVEHSGSVSIEEKLRAGRKRTGG